MGQITIQGTAGVEPVAWDAADKASVANAYRAWARLKRNGHEFFTASGRKVTRFNKRISEIIAVPRAE